MKNKKRICLRLLAGLFALLLLLSGYFSYRLIFESIPAGESALQAMADGGDLHIKTEPGKTVFYPDDPKAGLVFYTGARVDYESYAPLMRAFAKQGFLCVLLDSPCNFALFNLDAPSEIPAEYSEIHFWIIGGHSLGGTAASLYLGSHGDEYDGLLLLGSYPYADFKQSGIRMLCLYGAFDGVLSKSQYEAAKKNWPSDAKELVISGGNHAYFADYGNQPGDGTATITREAQIAFTADSAADFFLHE